MPVLILQLGTQTVILIEINLSILTRNLVLADILFNDGLILIVRLCIIDWGHLDPSRSLKKRDSIKIGTRNHCSTVDYSIVKFVFDFPHIFIMLNCKHKIFLLVF